MRLDELKFEHQIIGCGKAAIIPLRDDLSIEVFPPQYVAQIDADLGWYVYLMRNTVDVLEPSWRNVSALIAQCAIYELIRRYRKIT